MQAASDRGAQSFPKPYKRVQGQQRTPTTKDVGVHEWRTKRNGAAISAIAAPHVKRVARV
jgi:hypothetical protein